MYFKFIIQSSTLILFAYLLEIAYGITRLFEMF